jgi:hypothetical protein
MNIEFKEKLLRIVIFSNLLLQPIAAFLAAWYHLSFALVLFFFDGSDIFSTIRRHTEQKMEYYCGNIGKEFVVIIEPEKEAKQK